MIDLIKVIEFADSFERHMRELEELGNSKKDLVISTADSKLGEYNDNDILKTQAYNDNHGNKLKMYNDNTVSKINEYNENHRNMVDIYNSNSVSKTSDYDDNHSKKVEEYNSNALNKVTELQADYNSKLSEFRKVETSVKESEYDVQNMTSSIVGTKQDFDNKKTDFDGKYQGILDIVSGEKSRVEAEKLRAEHDTRIQKILNEGLNTELGSYLKKDVVTFVNSFGKKCMGVFKVIDGSPVIELVEVGE